LAIVGDGPELEPLKQLAAGAGIADRVLFPGRVEYQQMPGYFAAADFFCISSTTEVKPLVVLEALASGLPTVAVAACGTADTLTDGFDGVLTKERIDEFAAAMRRMVEQPEWRRLLARQARTTARQYSIEGYVERLVVLYNEAISRRARA
jgi:1,2-diacylglycerol 3-alpha-glucosyltransferase